MSVLIYNAYNTFAAKKNYEINVCAISLPATHKQDMKT